MGYCWGKGLAVLIGSTIALYANNSVAQITPDTTLPNNTKVNLEDKTFNITGGTSSGGNLFHSFKEFSVPTGETAFFNNGANIQNIINRVTGGNISNIDGLIKANGSANLFLINPSGFVFGENARLDIGGSFIGTTADSMRFSDGTEFSAVNTQSEPLLTVNVPLGLQYGTNPGSIEIRGNGEGRRASDSPIIDTQDALRVQGDKTLALIGGDINLEGATLKTAGGRIELGSVGENSLVNLVPTDNGFTLDYSSVENFRDIQLFSQTNVDASGEGGGDIQVQGKVVSLKDGSRIETSILRDKQGGDLVVNATELLEVIGSQSNLRTLVYPGSTGDAGDLTIDTEELVVRDGGGISASTFGEGTGGNLKVTAETIELVGISANGRVPSGLSASSNSSGDARDLTINTEELVLRDGAQIGAGTFGEGKGGTLKIKAETIELIGGSANGLFPTALAAQTSSSGDGGDVTINTIKLVVRDGAQISAGTFGEGKGRTLKIKAETIEVVGKYSRSLASGLFTSSEVSGDAGNLIIDTVRLVVRDGAQIGSGSLGGGKGGNLKITAETIELINGSGLFTQSIRSRAGDAGDLTIDTKELVLRDGAQISASTFGEGKGGDLTVTADTIEIIDKTADIPFSSGLFTRSNSGSGNAGDLNINTNTLLINRGRVSVTSNGTGNAGDLNINVNSLRLDNNATVSANTQSVTKDPNNPQANININSRDVMLRRNSNITTDARGENVIGGNINIDAGVLAGFEDSNITANSQDFRGGNIIIDTEGIFGMQFREQNSPFTSDITATGANENLSGNVEINIPELLVDVVDASNQISNACTPGGSQFQNEFVVTGRGGLPMTPTEPLQDTSILSAWVRLNPQSSSRTNAKIKPRPRKANNNKVIPRKQIVEATGWIVDKDGNIEFVADASQVNSQIHSKIPQQTPTACNG